MGRPVLAALLGVAILSGCAPQTDWTPTVDTYGNSRAQYLSRDLDECQAIAEAEISNAGEQTAKGATFGGVAGAVGGMVLGAMVGSPGRGAAIGAASGAIAGGGVANATNEEAYKSAFNNCMIERGHNVTS